MSRKTLAMATLSLFSALICAEEDQSLSGHHRVRAPSPDAPPITITINPEARVSVSRGGDLPPPVACGTAMELAVKILNQGFMTAPLQASLVHSVPGGAAVEFSAEPLKGARDETRVLRLTLEKPGRLDVTIAFRAKNDVPDLGGRDRIHFLMSCRAIQ